MTPTITPPSAAELAALLSAQAHRYPSQASISVVGDRGVKLRLPLVLGNPSGACLMPEGEKTSPTWSKVARAAFRGRAVDQQLAADFVRDCLLWPDKKTWAMWVKRWPGLVVNVNEALTKKMGQATIDVVSLDDSEEPPPEPIAAALDKYPQAAWCRLVVSGATLQLALDPPDAGAWQAFDDATERPNADAWEQQRTFAAGRIRALVFEEPMAVDEAFRRWPSAALAVILQIAHLVGNASEITLGEF